MTYVGASKWFDLVRAILQAHEQDYDILEATSNEILTSYYGARVKFARAYDRHVYRIEFDNPRFEALFRIRYSEYLC